MRDESSPSTAFCCGVAAHAVLRAGPAQLAHWRREPPPLTGQPIAASLVKHSDDQTLAAIGAMHTALGDRGWLGRSFADWGVLAAPNFFGRIGNAHTIQRYAQEGAWGVSPHMIPHHSLHAPSGTLSQLLKMHGPNFGISGAGQACDEAFLIAAALLAEPPLPGLWLLLTGHEREHLPTESGKVAEANPDCLAVALALVPDVDDAPWTLQVGADATRSDAAELTLAAFGDAVRGARAGRWRLPGIGWIELHSETHGVGSAR